MTCPHPCCSKQAYLRVQFLGRFFSHPSFHLSIASPHSLGSINNNMPMIPSCTWKFHPIHPIQVSLTSESALLSLSSWFLHNGLALNPEKSEAILLGTHARNRTISKSQVNVAGASIPLSTTPQTAWCPSRQ